MNYTKYRYSITITDQTGDIKENRSGVYAERCRSNAWGRPRDPNNWSYNIGMAFGGAGEGITMRGYTMHEHLEMFSLINMNGRLYDPVLGRMLSPDNYIQAPDNTQSYNRYSYCVNNPLKYTDPSGEIIEGAIVAAAGFTIGYVHHGLTQGEWGKDALIAGGITAAVATIGFYSAGTSLSVKSGLIYSAKFAANTAINSVLPPMQFQMGNVNLSIGIGVGFGTGGLGATSTFGISYISEDFSIGVGFGGNDNMLAWRGSASYNGIGASYGRTYYGSAIGPDGVSNAQTVGHVGFIAGMFSFRIENDFKKVGGDGNDRWRSNAATIGWGNWEIGTNLRNNFVEDGSEVEMDGKSLIYGKNRDNGAWKNGQTYSSPIWIGYRSGGNVTRVGYSTKYAQDATQNGIHKYFGPGRTNYFNKYDDFKRGNYMYSGYNNPYTLW